MSEPLDMPDGTGWWAFEGKGQDDAMNYRTVNVVMEEGGALWSFRDNERKPVSFWVGKWTRLTMPWDEPQPAIPPDVRETIRALILGEQAAITEYHCEVYGKEHLSQTQARIDAALVWLHAQPPASPFLSPEEPTP